MECLYEVISVVTWLSRRREQFVISTLRERLHKESQDIVVQ